jgi:RimJ/RimL family protein N-acetyltransferase
MNVENGIEIIIMDSLKTIDNSLLEKTVILRWGYNKDKLTLWKEHMKNMSPEWPSGIEDLPEFYLFVTQDENVIGYAYFCQNELDNIVWYYGDLIVDKLYRRKEVATKIIEKGINEIVRRGASKIVTYIDNDNEASQNLHKKIGFCISPHQNEINGFIKGDERTVYEYSVSR